MKTGIIGAMDVEVNLLKEKMAVRRTVTKASMEFFEGTIGNAEIVVVKSGVGKVNAAVCVQILADEFHVDRVLNTGVAGSLNNDINIGDIVISKDAVYHDVDAVNFGYQPGEVPGMHVTSFKADEYLCQLAYKAVMAAAPDVRPFAGRVASGDQFIREKDKKDWIHETFQADCTEMEGCAIAQAAYLNQIPFVIIRAISDKADESVAESYEIFEKKAAEHCAGITAYMLEHM
jgi:adenosylhomocysteine nucleosidase